MNIKELEKDVEKLQEERVEMNRELLHSKAHSAASKCVNYPQGILLV